MASILVLGGTSWLGGAVAAHALSLGHDVTCLARGASGEVPDGARWVPADRSDPAAYEALPTHAGWDLVVDVARQPGHVRGAGRALADRTRSWVFVSSCSVYARHDEPGADESAALLPALEAETGTPEQYGEGKVACELAVRGVRGGDALIARSGLIVGQGDPSERFGYWPARFADAAQDGGPVLVPDSPDSRSSGSTSGTCRPGSSPRDWPEPPAPSTPSAPLGRSARCSTPPPGWLASPVLS